MRSRLFLISMTPHDSAVTPSVSEGPGWKGGTRMRINAPPAHYSSYTRVRVRVGAFCRSTHASTPGTLQRGIG